MIDWLENWANQITLAVIIAVILEMIIPNGKNKKYIKMMINLYVLFVILNPIISKFINLDNTDLFKNSYKQYFTSSNTIEVDSNLKSDKIIQNTFENSIKQDIKNKLLAKGYKVTNISIYINNKDDYGTINNIKIQVETNEVSDNIESKKDNTSVKINKVEKVDISSEQKTTNKKKELTKSEKNEIKKILSEEYNMKLNQIEVN